MYQESPCSVIDTVIAQHLDVLGLVI